MLIILIVLQIYLLINAFVGARNLAFWKCNNDLYQIYSVVFLLIIVIMFINSLIILGILH